MFPAWNPTGAVLVFNVFLPCKNMRSNDPELNTPKLIGTVEATGCFEAFKIAKVKFRRRDICCLPQEMPVV